MANRRDDKHSRTPRTDAIVMNRSAEQAWPDHCLELAVHARDLERELAHANEERERLASLCTVKDKRYIELEAARSSTRQTEDGPLGGFAPVGPTAVALDFLLTQYTNELLTAQSDDTSVEDSIYHDAEATKLKRQIIDRFAASAIAPNDSIPMPKEWIEAAKCPNCGGQGWTAHQVAAGEWEQEQCQWCFEQWLALGQPNVRADDTGAKRG